MPFAETHHAALVPEMASAFVRGRTMAALLFMTRRQVITLLAAATGLLVTTASGHATMTEIRGGPGGSPFNLTCPAGQFLVGFQARAGGRIDALGILCAPYNASTKRFDGINRDPRMTGGKGGGPQESYCPPGEPMIGMRVVYTNGRGLDREYVNTVNLICPSTNLRVGFDKCIQSGESCNLDMRGRTSDQHMCQDEERATGIQGASGSAIDGMGLICGPLPAAPPASDGTASGPSPGGRPIHVTPGSGDRKFQLDTNLPGMDYRSQPLTGNNPQLCQQVCDNEAACKAWTFVKAGGQSARAMCWLKNDVPRAVRDANTVSGVKPVARQPIAYGFDMPGKDYRQVAASIFGDCQKLCEQEAQCKAWSWVPPGVQGPKAMCSLKNDVPPRVANPKAASGVKVASTSAPEAATPGATSRPGGALPLPPSAEQQSSASDERQRAANEAASAHAQRAANEQSSAAASSGPAANEQSSAGAAARPTANEQNGVLAGIDMPGKDYRNVELNDNANAPVACQSLCAQDAQCKAWTSVKAGVQGPKAMCWLKNDVPSRVSNPNTASGLKVARSPLPR